MNGPVEWPDVEAFWLDDIRRWGSMKADYGVHWRELPRRWPPWRVSHLQATGELIAVCQQSAPGGSGPVRLIAVVPSDTPERPGGPWYRTLEGLLEGWADVSGGDLAWVGRRLAARGVEVLTDAWR